MIIGFSRHGTGGGRGPVEYITSQERTGREAHPPEVLRGSPDNTRLLIDSLAFEHRYTSGVLSLALLQSFTADYFTSTFCGFPL
ncbi:hypothetical protein HLB02_24080 [Serratia nevei]|nr:hypothetical protein [Serratia nevei]